MNCFILTGLYRSGTTLLEKIISGHPQAFVASQPFPYLFFKAKNEFFRIKNLNRKLPLGHLFGEKEYTRKEFEKFLSGLFLSKREIEKLAGEMKEYTGFWSPWLLEDIRSLGDKTFLEIFRDVVKTGVKNSGKTDVIAGGIKEILTEEFMPFFLSNKIRVILIIRDPRDVLTSLNYGEGEKYTGLPRPTLFNIRNWRKSAAFAIAYKDHPCFMCLRYEDLIRTPEQATEEVAAFLELSVSGFRTERIEDEQNRDWQGNSSFFRASGIESANAGRFRDLLPREVAGFTEQLCFPEMCYFGYELLHVRSSGQEINPFQDPFEKARPGYMAGDPFRELEMERTRLELLKNQYIDAEKAEHWFIFPEVHEVLQKQLRSF